MSRRSKPSLPKIERSVTRKRQAATASVGKLFDRFASICRECASTHLELPYMGAEKLGKVIAACTELRTGLEVVEQPTDELTTARDLAIAAIADVEAAARRLHEGLT